MAVISKMIDLNEKKIDISKYISEELREPEKPDYVTIQKLPYEIKKKLDFMSLNNSGNQLTKALFQYLKKNNIKPENIMKLDDNQKVEVMLNLNVNQAEVESLVKASVDMVSLTINAGVNPKKHSFIDDTGATVEINYDILSKIGNNEMIDYLVEEIKLFSSERILGESNRTA